MCFRSVRPLDTGKQSQFTGHLQKMNQFMETSGKRPPAKPETCLAGGASRLPGFNAIMLGSLLLIGGFTPAQRLAGAPLFPPADKREANPAPESTGPTLYLNPDPGQSSGNPVSEFMYFVPLISLEPVSVVKSPGNTQHARMVSATRSFSAGSFLVTCEFEFTGEGTQQNIFDHTKKIHRHERELKEGGLLDHQLGSINVEGAGSFSVEVEGTMAGQVPTVTEVRLRFNGRGRSSLVTIDIHDIGYFDGAFRLRNESIARVNTLIFRRSPGLAKMDITVGSVKPKNAGDGLWQNLMGGLKATTVNLFLKPIIVDPVGNEAMLNFGLALESEASAFTFPRARNLRVGGIGSAHETITSNSLF